MPKAGNKRKPILDAAQRLLEREGILRLTTKEIAREAQCAEGTLFKYFPRKEDILLAVVLENAPQFREKLREVRPGSGTVAKNLEQMGLAAIGFFEKLMPLTVALFADGDLLERHRVEMQEKGRGPGDVFAIVGAYIDAEQRLKRIRGDVAPACAAALLLGPCFQRVMIRQVMGRDLLPPGDRKFVGAIVATLLLGLKP